MPYPYSCEISKNYTSYQTYISYYFPAIHQYLHIPVVYQVNSNKKNNAVLREMRETRENRPFISKHPIQILLPQMTTIRPNSNFRSITSDNFKSSKYRSSDIRLIIVDIALIRIPILIAYSSLIDYSLISISITIISITPATRYIV